MSDPEQTPSGEPAVSQAGDVDGSSVRDVDGAVGLATAVADRVAAHKHHGSAVGAGGGVLRQGRGEADGGDGARSRTRSSSSSSSLSCVKPCARGENGGVGAKRWRGCRPKERVRFGGGAARGGAARGGAARGKAGVRVRAGHHRRHGRPHGAPVVLVQPWLPVRRSAAPERHTKL